MMIKHCGNFYSLKYLDKHTNNVVYLKHSINANVGKHYEELSFSEKEVNNWKKLFSSVPTDKDKKHHLSDFKLWLRLTEQLNPYTQVLIKGSNCDITLLLEAVEVNLSKYIIKLLHRCSKYTNEIKINNKVYATKWSDIYKACDCKAKITQQNLKAFLIDKSIIRIEKNRDEQKRFVLNPFYLRKSAYIHIDTVYLYKDFFLDLDKPIEKRTTMLSEELKIYIGLFPSLEEVRSYNCSEREYTS